MSGDFLYREPLAETAPFVADLISREEERQRRKLIMIPSESYAPASVREALGSVFQNIYAEGYPRERTFAYPEELLTDQSHALVYYRRYANRRFYKGVDYVDIIESLAARRAAKCFAKPGLPDTDIFVNVQALSGSAANLSVYEALLRDGDTFMGLDLFQGGHLTHGSEFNQSGKRYNVVSYGVDPKTEKLNYDAIRALALEHRPKLIIAGYTSYPWAPDFEKFREIADETGAFLMADIAHTAGLAIGGVYPNPVGIADVAVFTTHKTLGGPRGAVILSTDEEIAAKIDDAVFPGAQGGPHVNKMAALAVVFKLAGEEKFAALQRQTVENARVLAEAFQEQGLRVVYGGTDTHIVLVDVSSVGTNPPVINRFTPGIPLRGEIAARILDIAGIVVNKNTIPGDTLTALARGIRFGTPWVTQRGFGPDEMREIAGIVKNLITSIRPFSYIGVGNELPRGKTDLGLLERAKRDVDTLSACAGFDLEVRSSGYPHFDIHACDDQDDSAGAAPEPKIMVRVSGWRAEACLQELCTINVSSLAPGRPEHSFFLDGEGRVIADIGLCREEADCHGRDRFLVQANTGGLQTLSWLRGIADGYVIFDTEDIFRKIQGPVVVEELTGEEAEQAGLVFASMKSGSAADPGDGDTMQADVPAEKKPGCCDLTKPYFVGQQALVRSIGNELLQGEEKKAWRYSPGESSEIKKTELNGIHRSLKGKMVPFAGWDMPVWYTAVSEEHQAVRNAAGLFDVSHMGCFEVTGPHAVEFLDIVASNYIHWLEDGESCYSYLLDTDGNIIDDIMVYRLKRERILVVVNAANEEKDWDWLRAVNEGDAIIDRERPWIKPPSKAGLHNCKFPSEGGRQLRGIALQGPASKDILKSCISDTSGKDTIQRLKKTRVAEIPVNNFQVIAAHTGYTGEKTGYELYCRPEQLSELWETVMEAGREKGLKPCGLASRDSLRIEAGLPLYGHELAGAYNISPAEAGFPGYVKYHKPFFVGRDVLLQTDMKRSREIIRWGVEVKGVRRPNPGDLLAGKNGAVIGHVTSCSINTEGFLTGLALVGRQHTRPGTDISIYLKGPAGGTEQPSILSAALGDKLPVPVPAKILSRFPV